jgi:hypothetical protein
MEAKDIGGALAGGLLATQILEALVAEGVLTNAKARHLLLKVLDAIEGPPVIQHVRLPASTPEGKAAAAAIRHILPRFPENE